MKQQRRIRILIAERHAVPRSAMTLFVQKQPGLEVVGEAADDDELLSQVDATRPDVVLLDWDLGDRSPAELVRALRKRDGTPAVIVLDVQPESAQAALEAGADAFVNQGDPPVGLLAAIHSVRAEGRWEPEGYSGSPEEYSGSPDTGRDRGGEER